MILHLFGVPAAADAEKQAATRQSIQAALNLSVAGDTIVVEPGVYPGSLNFAGKDVALVGRDGAVLHRYAPQTKPEDIAGDVEKALQQ